MDSPAQPDHEPPPSLAELHQTEAPPPEKGTAQPDHPPLESGYLRRHRPPAEVDSETIQEIERRWSDSETIQASLLLEIERQTGLSHEGMEVLAIWPAPRGLSVQVALSRGQVDTPMLFLRLPPEQRDDYGEAWMRAAYRPPAR